MPGKRLASPADCRLKSDVVATFTLLALAILALWIGEGDRASRARRYLWLWIGAASVPVAIVSGVLEPVGLIVIAAFAATTYAFSRPDAPRGQRITSAVLLIVGATALFALVAVANGQDARSDSQHICL